MSWHMSSDITPPARGCRFPARLACSPRGMPAFDERAKIRQQAYRCHSQGRCDKSSNLEIAVRGFTCRRVRPLQGRNRRGRWLRKISRSADPRPARTTRSGLHYTQATAATLRRRVRICAVWEFFRGECGSCQETHALRLSMRPWPQKFRHACVPTTAALPHACPHQHLPPPQLTLLTPM